MQIWKGVRVSIEGRSSEVKALFDSGSTFTLMGYSTLKELFGEVKVKPLPKIREAALTDGRKITIDGYVDSQIMVDEYLIAERIYLSKEMVRKAILEGREVSLPDLIVGSPTMETGGIELDLKKGEVVIRGGAFLL